VIIDYYRNRHLDHRYHQQRCVCRKLFC